VQGSLVEDRRRLTGVGAAQNSTPKEANVTIRRLMLLTAGLLVAAIGIAACGGSGAGSSTPKPSQTATPVAEAAQTTPTTGSTTTTPTTTAHKHSAHSSQSQVAAGSSTAATDSAAGSAQTATTGTQTATTGTHTTTTGAQKTSTGAQRVAKTGGAIKQKKNGAQVVAEYQKTQAALQSGGVPQVSGATPAAGFMASCMSDNGLGDAQLLRANEWRGVVALKVKPVYIDGPYSSVSQAETAAGGLEGIESVASGGLYVVSAVLADHLDSYVDALAKCLAAAGDAPSGQPPISG
jgi:hypothetical protein